MKTLLITLEYPPFKGGVARYYEAIIKFWPKKTDIEVLDNRGLKLVKPLWPFLKWLPSVWHIFKKVKSNKVDYLIIGQILPLGTAAYIITRLTRTPYAVILHGMDFTYTLKHSRKKLLTKIILNEADKIICASSYTALLVSDFLSKAQSKKIYIVNPGIDPSQVLFDQDSINKLCKQYNLQGKKVIFSLGRLVKRKGFDMMIKSMPRILEKKPDAYYYIAGSGPDEKYLKKIANRLIKNKIIFLGKISERDKWTWLSLCDIYSMPARVIRSSATDCAHPNNNLNGGDFEGFGIVYLEANLAKKPVIAGRSGGVEDAVVDYETGILVDPESPDDIADGAIELLSDRKLSNSLGEQGWRRAVEEFSWEKQAKKIFYIINND